MPVDVGKCAHDVGVVLVTALLFAFKERWRIDTTRERVQQVLMKIGVHERGPLVSVGWL